MHNKSFFNKLKGSESVIKLLLGIIGGLMIIIVFMLKGYIGVIQNKTVTIQIPQFMESGKYIIGNTFASDNTYKMWAKVWVEDIANFSYQNIREKYANIYPFLDKQTALKSKSDMIRFIEFVEGNFITQNFQVSSIELKKLPGNYKKITVYGTVHRTIGSSKDQLNGMRYAYEFITYVKNGQIYIKSIKTSFYSLSDKRQRDKLKENTFVNFDDIIQ